MAEALSRSEVESLLSALKPGQIPPSPSTVEHPPSSGPHVSSSELARRVVGRFEKFRHAVGSATEQMLPEPARIKRHMPVRIPLSELRTWAGENPLLILAEAEQNGGDLLIILECEFAVQFVSCMLGQPNQNDGRSVPEPRQSLSPIERQLLLRWLRESLEKVSDPDCWNLVEIEFISFGRDLDAYHSQSPWWCEVWELKAEQLRGRIEICGQWEFFSTLTEAAEVAESSAPAVPGPLRGAQNEKRSESLHDDDESESR